MPDILVQRPYDRVALVKLNRPAQLNALDDDLVQVALPRVIAEIDADPTISVVVLTGEGRGFCSGGDLLRCTGFRLEDTAASEENVRIAGAVPVALTKMRTVSIAAVNGPAVGAGFGLALACDFRFAATKAYFKAPFADMGLVTDYGVSYFLPRLVGSQAALDIMLTARRVYAPEARELGLVWRVSDTPLIDALGYAHFLAQKPPATMAAIRRILHQSADADVETHVLVNEARAQGLALHSEEFLEHFGSYRAGVIAHRGP